MSLTIDEEDRAPGPDRPEKAVRPAADQSASKPFWRRPWIIPLFLVTGVFLYLQALPFAGTPEAKAEVPPHDGFTAYYPLLLTHIALGTIAMIACCFQVWPWLRRQHPAVHRVSGRIYVAATVVSAVCGLIVLPYAPVVGQIGAFMSTSLWLVTTVAGFWAVRTGRYALHRTLMLYSFALVMNNVWGRAFAEIIFGFGINIDFAYLGEFGRWVGWTVNLMLVQVFLYRTSRRPVEGPARRLTRVGD